MKLTEIDGFNVALLPNVKALHEGAADEVNRLMKHERQNTTIRPARPATRLPVPHMLC